MTLEIFIPFWGEPALLYQTVDSVRAQRNPDWRLIVIDDCYPDGSVREYFATLDDDRITYVRNEKNLGITGNFRESARRATRSHLSILGCDDLLQPDYVDVIQATIAAVPDADVIQPGVDVVDGEGVLVRPLVDRVKQRVLAPRGGDGIAVLRGERMATSLIRGDWLYWPSLTFRAETLRRIDFREDLPIIQDLALLMDIAFDGGCLAYNPKVVFSYRRHGESASQKALLDGRRFRDERRYYALARDLATARGWRRTAKTAQLRIMSRLHAITELPAVLRHGTRPGVRAALEHIVG
jgi:glycosyltransferase involved in cell wall biosynthesis